MPHVPDKVKEFRHRRFLELLTKHRAKDLAKKLDLPENYISNVKNLRKSIGETNARDWEVKLDLPKYWFDGDDVAATVAEPKQSYHGVMLTRAGAQFAEEWEKLDIEDRVSIEEQVMTKVAAQKRGQRPKRRPARTHDKTDQ